MEQNQQYINIDECVLAYLEESEQNKSSRYWKCWQLAYRAADELGLDIFYAIKTELLRVSANGVVDLPSDYISYCKIGNVNGNNEIISFTRNDSFNFNSVRHRDVIPNTEATYLQSYYSGSPVFYNYWNGNSLISFVCSGTSSFGHFRIDEENRVIVLPSSFSGGSVMLEYKASPSEEMQSRIPKQFKEAVIAYIAWKDIRYLPSSRRGNISDKQQRRHEYFNERRLAKARYQPLYLQEAYEAAMQFTPSVNSY
jgi:hypothetical protein